MSQPSPPDPSKAAGQAIGVAGQTATDINQPIATENQAGSNYNQFDPYGSLTYSQTGTGPGGVPIYSSSVQLSPAQQTLLNQLQGTQTTAGGQAGNLLSNANYGSASPTDVIGNLTSGLTGQNMAAYLSSADPFFKTQSDQLDTQLRNQGLQPGQPAYDNAMRSLTTNQGYSVYGAAASFEPQAFQQATTEYELPEQLATQLAQFGAPANPTQQFETGSGLNIQTPNTSADLGSMVTADQNQYTAQQNQYNAMIKGLMSIAGGAVAA